MNKIKLSIYDIHKYNLDVKKSASTANSLLAISVIIPTFNEEDFIIDCIQSLFSGNYPTELIEIMIVDGGSTDQTRELVRQFIEANDVCMRLLDNPKKSLLRRLILVLRWRGMTL